MACKALSGQGLAFDLIMAEDIRAGVLKEYAMLFVPGGWASNKSSALGEEGLRAIRDFVQSGGSYLGFCGGAGLATKAKGCLGLLDIKRRPTKERVPSFSGRIHLNIDRHQIWKAPSTVSRQPSADVFHAWWPSQFMIEDKGIKVLATYGDALPDAFSSDLNVGDIEGSGGWKAHEELYGINLDPARLKNEPCVLEGRYGRGRVILSLIHFDTPGDLNGQRVLVNLWKYLGGDQDISEERKCGSAEGKTAGPSDSDASELFDLCSGLIALGERNFLWFWRNPMLLQWRRGVRGLEYNTLYIMMKEISAMIMSRDDNARLLFAPALGKIRALLVPFIEKAEHLLILERRAMQKGPVTYDKCDDPGIQRLREELFSTSKSYGGMFKELLDEMCGVLFTMIR
ncbi:MAG: BPL-N domain-containing protein [Nitrospirota bacterium]|nr:BPL-N domain-containing protein [Nitrospirota bacterium]